MSLLPPSKPCFEQPVKPLDDEEDLLPRSPNCAAVGDAPCRMAQACRGLVCDGTGDQWTKEDEAARGDGQAVRELQPGGGHGQRHRQSEANNRQEVQYAEDHR